MRKQTAITWLAGTLAIALSAPAGAKTLVYCSEGSPENFNPQLYTSGTSVDASAVPIYNRLVDFIPGTTELVPSLAERWEIGEGGRVYTFTLRQGVKFQGNKYFTPTRDFNADDVIFSFMRQKDPQHPYHHVSHGTYANFNSLEFGSLIQSIEKLDDRRVRFTLSHPEAPFLADLAWYFASILSAEYAEAMMKAGTPERVDNDPLGTGPFQLVQYQPDSRLVYKAFPAYWQGKAKLDRLVFSITPDASVRYARLRKNECQVMPFPNPADLERMRADPALNVLEKPGLNIGFLAFNTQKPPLDRVEVRQALSMAIDKPAIIAAIFQGSARVAKNLLPPTVWGAANDLPDTPYDPARAATLLRQAGIAEGSEITLWAMPVQRPYNPNARRMAEMIQADWARVGIRAKIVSYEWGEYLKRVRAGEHQAELMGWTTATGDPDNFFGPLFSCTSAQGGSNSSQWCDHAFDTLINRARAEPDRAVRGQLYHQAQQRMQDQAPAVMIAHATLFEPVRNNVVGYEVDPFGKHLFWPVDLR
ncbi:ABC transporter substrate-binding protein [Pantoea sp. 1.19]|uniref:ABC transporter substrate-binding protein n=1 Tax=Pantoea sp. 1.19 TaxID=1925589 RepID=UPI000948E997|nr:ABC transporter substrate-binding protein [Pantoea sp. 1.19]